MKKSILLSVAALSALTVANGAPKAFADATGQVPLYRTYNPNSGEHFYTTSYAEAENAYNAGWNIEGVGWQTPDSGAPVYRVFNPNSQNAGSHYYTANKAEADYLVGLGWKWDNNGNPVFYSGGSNPVYVEYNGNNSAHNYTTSSYEANSVIKTGWQENNVTIYAVGEGNQNGAKIHPAAVSSTAVRSTAVPRQVDVGSLDIPDHSYRTLYPNNAWPTADQVAVPTTNPTAVFKGTVSVKDADAGDGGAKYSIITVGGTTAGMVGVGFQHVANAEDTEFGGGKISMLLLNYKPNVTNGGQYYVTISDGVNQTGTNSFEIDYFANEQVAVYKLNGNIVTSLKAQINFNQMYAFHSDRADASDSFTANAFGSSQSWQGEVDTVDFRG